MEKWSDYKYDFEIDSYYKAEEKTDLTELTEDDLNTSMLLFVQEELIKRHGKEKAKMIFQTTLDRFDLI